VGGGVGRKFRGSRKIGIEVDRSKSGHSIFFVASELLGIGDFNTGAAACGISLVSVSVPCRWAFTSSATRNAISRITMSHIRDGERPSMLLLSPGSRVFGLVAPARPSSALQLTKIRVWAKGSSTALAHSAVLSP
jgi:hypothetical protein